MLWRREHCGCLAFAFGAGLLIGAWLESGILCNCIGVGAIAFGVWILLKK